MMTEQTLLGIEGEMRRGAIGPSFSRAMYVDDVVARLIAEVRRQRTEIARLHAQLDAEPIHPEDT